MSKTKSPSGPEQMASPIKECVHQGAKPEVAGVEWRNLSGAALDSPQERETGMAETGNYKVGIADRIKVMKGNKNKENNIDCIHRKKERSKAADRKNNFSDNAFGPPEAAVGFPVATS
ncbi:hypothetical protein BTVI_54112 [Pitangus sulphuratus]|nr:hypothetical protein BTVI_54112 [Pitangus sulphuratus]